MIKRSGAILLAILYLVTVFGFALNLHYCANILASVKIDSPSKICKTLSGKKLKCCKDTQVSVKIKDAHQAASPSFLAGLFAFDLPRAPFCDYLLSAQQALLEKLLDRGPPPASTGKIATYLKNRTLRV